MVYYSDYALLLALLPLTSIYDNKYGEHTPYYRCDVLPHCSTHGWYDALEREWIDKTDIGDDDDDDDDVGDEDVVSEWAEECEVDVNLCLGCCRNYDYLCDDDDVYDDVCTRLGKTLCGVK